MGILGYVLTNSFVIIAFIVIESTLVSGLNNSL